MCHSGRIVLPDRIGAAPETVRKLVQKLVRNPVPLGHLGSFEGTNAVTETRQRG
jgi:hypothetical protein